MIDAQPRICPGEWDAQTSPGFWNTNWSPNLGKTTRPCNNQLQKKIVDFAVSADHRIKLKENKRRISTCTLLENWKI